MTSYYDRVSVAICIHVTLSYTNLVAKAFVLYLVRASEGFRVKSSGSIQQSCFMVRCYPMLTCPTMCFLKDNFCTYFAHAHIFFSSLSILAWLTRYHKCGTVWGDHIGSPPSQHQHCTDEAQKAETVLSTVRYSSLAYKALLSCPN